MSVTPGLHLRRYYGAAVPAAFTLLLALALAGCSLGTQPVPTSPPAVTQGPDNSTATTAGPAGIDSAQALLDALGKAGIAINSTGPIDQPFFSVKGSSYEAGKGYLQIFEYADQAAAESDAAKIKPDGSIDGFSPSWVASPHFYRLGRLIVIYLGDEARDLSGLKSVLGDPFASVQIPVRP